MSGRDQRAYRTRPMEWWLAGISAVLLSAAVGYLVYDGLTFPDGPPQVTVRAGEPRAVDDGFIVGFTARNDGRTAANVQIVGEIPRSAEGAPERSEVVLDYVPRGSTRKGWLHFTRDPTGNRLTVSVGGLAEP